MLRQSSMRALGFLVTAAALTLAASIVAPCFPRAFATSRSAGCMNNLHHLGALLHTETDESLGLPGGPVTTVSGAWRLFLAASSCCWSSGRTSTTCTS